MLREQMIGQASQHGKVRLHEQKVLIIKLQYVGDTLGVIPVVANLKRHAPGLTVDVLIHAECAPLIAHHADIRKVWVYDRGQAKKNFVSSIAYHLPLIRNLRREKYDIVIALTQGDRAFFLARATGAALRLTYWLPGLPSRMMNAFAVEQTGRRHFIEMDVDILNYFGIEDREVQLIIPMPENIRREARKRLLPRAGSAAVLAAIHPGARKIMRQWRPDRYAEIASRLQEQYGASIVLLGGPEDQQLLDEIETKMGFAAALKSCSLSLLDMAAVFSECDLFIGNDSGPGHIAAAVGCPTLSLFGPNFPVICRPYIASGEVIFKNLDCSGCRQEKHLCVHPENTCLDRIGVEEVWAKVRTMLAKEKRSRERR
ncbi:MAG: glycosyltransferase family 9 protein [Deltaproteobacteria bacterium]|nr:glycosyltransferase family 9 protein [Deltaproteobacteria bacterium]